MFASDFGSESNSTYDLPWQVRANGRSLTHALARLEAVTARHAPPSPLRTPPSTEALARTDVLHAYWRSRIYKITSLGKGKGGLPALSPQSDLISLASGPIPPPKICPITTAQDSRAHGSAGGYSHEKKRREQGTMVLDWTGLCWRRIRRKEGFSESGVWGNGAGVVVSSGEAT